MRKRVFLGLVSLCLAAAFPGISAHAGKNASPVRQFSKPIPKNRRIPHALDRLTFGPRPGDAGQVRAMGLGKWIDLQLHPEQTPENPVLEEKLKTLDSLAMTSDELVRNYPPPQIVRQMAAGEVPFPSDPDRRLMIQKLVARYQKRQGQANLNEPGPQEMSSLLTPDQVRALRTGTPQERLAAFQALPK